MLVDKTNSIAYTVFWVPGRKAFEDAIFKLAVSTTVYDFTTTDGAKYLKRVYVFADGSWLTTDTAYLEDGALSNKMAAFCVTGHEREFN